MNPEGPKILIFSKGANPVRDGVLLGSLISGVNHLIQNNINAALFDFIIQTGAMLTERGAREASGLQGVIDLLFPKIRT